jgi:hypothetical protein
MKLIAYPVEGHSIDIRPAPATRDWMDATRGSFAYRCLPLNIANAHGWEVLCPVSFTAIWSGAREGSGVSVVVEGETVNPPYGHFGDGILTFDINCVFRTEPGYDLIVQGPANRPKDGIAPLSGIIETDWAPYTFTMNWQFTRSGHQVRFEKGEPICSFFPIQRHSLESVEPVLGSIGDDPELARAFADWKASRDRFITDRKNPETTAHAEKWQKNYYRGLQPDGERKGVEDHRIRVRLKPFSRKQPANEAR